MQMLFNRRENFFEKALYTKIEEFFLPTFFPRS